MRKCPRHFIFCRETSSGSLFSALGIYCSNLRKKCEHAVDFNPQHVQRGVDPGHLVKHFLSFRSLGQEDIPYDLFVNQRASENSYVRFTRDIDDFVHSVVRDQSGAAISGAVLPCVDLGSVLAAPGDGIEEAADDAVVQEDGRLVVQVHNDAIDDAEPVEIPEIPQPPPPICTELSKALRLLQTDR